MYNPAASHNETYIVDLLYEPVHERFPTMWYVRPVHEIFPTM